MTGRISTVEGLEGQCADSRGISKFGSFKSTCRSLSQPKLLTRHRASKTLNFLTKCALSSRCLDCEILPPLSHFIRSDCAMAS